jgi:hypothetical protein
MVFSDFAKLYGAASCGGIKRSQQWQRTFLVKESRLQIRGFFETIATNSMSIEEKTMVTCGRYQPGIDEEQDIPILERTPCPSCGSTSRMFAQPTIGGTVTVHSQLRVKARHPGPGKPFAKFVKSDDPHRKTGNWMRLERFVDSAKSWCREVVTEPRTQEVIHRCEEPLTHHRNHGFGKLRSRVDDGY